MKDPLSPNTLLSHYQILGKLGAGGKSEVWRARDTRLEGEVASKVLPADSPKMPTAGNVSSRKRARPRR